MAKTRLNTVKRNLLLTHVRNKVVYLDRKTAIEAKRAELDKLTATRIKKHFPSAELKVLKKYYHASYKNNIGVCVLSTVETESPQYFGIILNTPTLLPGNMGYSRNNSERLVITADDKLLVVIKELDVLKKSYDALLSDKQQPYLDLINGAKTFEDVVEVWPEADEIRKEVCGSTGIVAISNASIIEIRKDTNLRKKLNNQAKGTVSTLQRNKDVNQ